MSAPVSMRLPPARQWLPFGSALIFTTPPGVAACSSPHANNAVPTASASASVVCVSAPPRRAWNRDIEETDLRIGAMTSSGSDLLD